MNGHASINRIYRLVWSQARLAWVAVSEIGRHGGGISSATRAAGAIAALGLIASGALAAPPAPTQLPTGGSVAAGSAIISQTAARMDVSQTSQRAVINWNTFNVGAQAQVNFNQPGSTAVILNRVLDTQASQIAGRITANGQVILVNPNGVYFTKGSSVDVGALIATTHSISDSDFMAGRNVFSRNGATGSVVNEGSLTAALGGYIALLAPEVRNQGVIVARMGTVALASGETVSLQFDGSSLAGVVVTPSQIQALVDNHWAVQAPGGQIILSAKAVDRLLGGVVKNSGSLEAGGLVNDGGRIILEASDRIQHSGSMGADAAAGSAGKGGTVSLIADLSNPDSLTQVNGSITARGGNAGGYGGFVETSGSRVQVAEGAIISTSAPSGRAGSWLIDPVDFTIAASGGDISGATLGSNLGFGYVTIASTSGAGGASGNVNVNDTVSWSANTLTLNAQNNININSGMNGTGTASLALQYGQATQTGGSSAYNVYAAVNLPAGNHFSTQLGTSGPVLGYTVIASLGAAASPTPTDLQGIGAGLSGNYVLGSNIDASGTSSWNSNAGFAPIGTSGTPFNGIFDGLGHVISGLVINRSGTNNIGLFGVTDTGSVVRNLGLTNVAVTGGGLVGGLIGDNKGTLLNTYVMGTVNASTYAGGLVGQNDGTIKSSFTSGTIDVWNRVGGLVGVNNASISNSYSSMQITANHGQDNFGGLVGQNFGNISNSYASGSVVFLTANNTGGFVGYNGGTVAGSYWNSSANATIAGIGGGTLAGTTGLTASQMKTASSFSAWDMATSGGSTSVWRIYDGSTSPLLRSLLQPLNLTSALNGGTQTLGSIADYTASVASPVTSHIVAGSAGLTVSTTATAGSATAMLSGFVSDQSGYDISYSGRTISGTGSSASDLILPGTLGWSSGTLSLVASGSISLSSSMTNTAAVSFNGGNATVTQTSGPVTLGAVTLSGQMKLTAGGNIGQASGTSITVGGATTLKSSSGNISLSNAGNDFVGSVNASAASIGLADANSIVIGTITAGTRFDLFYGRGAVAAGNTASYSVSGTVDLPAGQTYSTTQGADGSTRNFTVITSLGAQGSTTGTDLQGINGNLSANYALGGNIDASASANWSSGAGFRPLGLDASGFLGVFDGLGHTISNLVIKPQANTNNGVGLFSGIAGGASLQNLGLVSVNVTDTSSSKVGALAGWNNGTISNSYAWGTVSGNNTVGGLVGANNGPLYNSYMAGTVSGNTTVGGIAGENVGNIYYTYATAAVTGSVRVGGLVGMNFQSVNASYAIGAVTGQTGVTGALIGENNTYASISNSYWSPDVAGQLPGVAWGGGSNGSAPLTSTQMRTASNFAGFNFTSTPGAAGNNWVMVDSDGTLNNAGNDLGAARPMLASEYSQTVSNGHQLQLMAMNRAASYSIGSNIDASSTGNGKDVWAGAGFVPVGSASSAFTGTLDGQGYAVSGLTINLPTTDYVGLIGSASGAVIKNLGLIGASVTGRNQVGSLVGAAVVGSLTNSYASGGSVSGTDQVGGLVGYNNTMSTSRSYTSNAVSGRNSVGGLFGETNGGVGADYNYSLGDVTGTGQYVGGLVGYNGFAFSIGNSYATGAVSGASDVGGLAGYNLNGTLSTSYAMGVVAGSTNVGGLIGRSDGTVTNSYWNSETSGQSGSAGGTARTSAQMMALSTFSSWGISGSGGSSAVWRIYEGITAPLLRSFLAPLTLANVSVTYDGSAHNAASTAVSGVLGAAATGTNSGSYNTYYSTQQGYDLTGGNLTIDKANLTLSGSRTYDGSTTLAGGALTAMGVNGESFAVTGLGDTSNLTSKNVQTASALGSVSGLSLGAGSGLAGNYNVLSTAGSSVSITRLNSVTWSGGAAGSWFDPSNWVGGAVPDLSNVANVVIPSGVVSFNSSVVSPAQAGTVHLNSVTTSGTGALSLAAGALNVATSLQLAALTQSGGSLGGNGSIQVASFNQTAGSISNTGNFTVSQSFTQASPGTVAVGGDIGITQATGVLGFSSLAGGNIALTASNGSVVLGNVTATGNLGVTATGAITQNAALTVAGTTTLTAGANDITLANGSNDFTGVVSVVSGNYVSITDTNSLLLGSIAASGDLAVTAAGGIALGGNITTGGAQSYVGNLGLQSGAISLVSATGGVSVAGDITGTVPVAAMIEFLGGGAYQYNSSVYTVGGASSGLAIGYSGGAYSWNPTYTGTAQMLVAAGGGGGGGSYVGGGGGGGGVLYTSSYALNASTQYSVVVGSGGTGGAYSAQGSNGGNSSFTGGASLTAIGGGGGGSYSNNQGLSGGSGGGAGWQGSPGAATTGQGNSGAWSTPSPNRGGGGGGAGRAGGNGGSDPAAGGDGLAYSLSGTSTYYGGGGGAGSDGTAGTGGLGGGGAGGTPYNNGANGAANTGGGGGGGGGNSQAPVGGTGGSGIVVVSYQRPSTALSIQAGNGAVSLSGAISNLSTLTVNSASATSSISGNLSGTASLVKQGSGKLLLSGTNTYSGGTQIDGGTLALGSAGALGSSGTISFGGGTLQFGSANNADYSSRFSTAAGQAYSIDTNGVDVTIADALTSSGGTLTKSGFGTLVLSGTNTYSGTTRINAGTLQLGAGSTSGSIAGSITNNAFVVFNRSDTLSFGRSISGTGTLSKFGAGALTLTGTNTYSGATTVGGGALVIENDAPNLSSSSYGGAGTLSIQPASSSFTGLFSTAGINFDSTLGGLTLGKSGNSSDITVAAGLGIAGPITLYGGNIALNGSVLAAAGSVLVKGNGNITLASGHSVTTLNGNISLVAGGNFQTNNSTSNALSAGGAGSSWRVWSSDPANDTRGGLVYDFKQYNAVYGSSLVQGTGSGFLYTLAPSISTNLTGTISKIYDSLNTAPLSSGNYTSSGAVDGDTVTLTLPVSGTYTTAGTGGAIQDVGAAKTVSVSGIAISTATSNTGKSVYGYTVTNGGGATGNSGAISPRLITVTADAGQTKIYGNSDPTLGYTLETAGTNRGLVGSDTFAGTLSRVVGETVTGGPYAISQGSLANGNYAISYTGASFAITPRPISVTVDAGQTKIYGNVDPTLGYTLETAGTNRGLVGSDTFAGTLSRVAGETVTGGPYAISQGSLANGNYAISYTGASFAITPRPISVTADAGQTKIYGNSDPTAYGFASTSLGSGTALVGALDRAAGENVGSYAIGRGGLTDGANPNYAITYSGDSFAISQRPITVTAADQSRFYGSANPTAGAVNITNGSLVNGDTLGTASVTSLATANTAAGQAAALTPYSQIFSAGSAGNYAISYQDGTLSIGKAHLTVMANNATKSYGEANPALNATVSGFVNGETLATSGVSGSGSATTTATAATGVGTVPVTAGVGSLAAANYDFPTLVAGTLGIGKANLTLSGAREYDGSTVVAGSVLMATGVRGETFAVTGAGDTSNLLGKNVQTASTLASVTGLGVGAGTGLSSNYNDLSTAGSSVSISRRSSVSWIGGASGNWFDPANWTAGAVPDLANVHNVVIPSSTIVRFDSGSVVSPAQAGAVSVDGISGSGALNLATGSLNVAISLQLGALAQSGGSLGVNGNVQLGAFSQSGGAVSSTGDLTVTDSYSQSGQGSLFVGGNVDITQTSGLASLGSIQATGRLSVVAPAGMDLSGDIATSGRQSYTGPLTVSGGNRVLATTNADVVFAGTIDSAAASSSSLTVNAGTGAVRVTGANGGSTPLASLATGGSGTTTLGGDVTTIGAQTYGGPVVLSGGNRMLATTNADVSFAGSVDADPVSAAGLTVNAGTGSPRFGGAVGSTTPLTSLFTLGTGTTFLSGNVTTAGDQRYGGDVTLNSANVILKTNSNGAVRIAGQVTSNGSFLGANTQSYLTSSTWTTTQGGTNPYQLSVDLGQNWTYQADYLISSTPGSMDSGGLNTIFSYGNYADGILLRTTGRGDSFYLKGNNLGAVDLLGSGVDRGPGTYVTIKLSYANNGTTGTLNVYTDNVLKATQTAAGDLNPGNKVLSIGSAGHAANEGLNATLRNVSLTSGNAVSAALSIDTGAGAAAIAGGAAGLSSLSIRSSAPDSTIGGVISGSTQLIKQGSGTLSLSAANTYGGGTTVVGGTLKAGSSTSGVPGAVTAGPFGTATVTVNAGASLDVNGQTLANDLGLAGAGIGGQGALMNSSPNGALVSGAIALADTTAIGSASLLTLTGPISGNQSILFIGDGGVTATNPGNVIQSVAARNVGFLDLAGSGSLAVDRVNLVDGISSVGSVRVIADSVSLNKSISASGSGNIVVRAGAGDLLIGNGTTVSAASGNIDLLGARIVNLPAGSPLSASGYWRVWSTNPDPFSADPAVADIRGSLAGNFKQYNASYGGTVLGVGNGLLYSFAPILAVSPIGSIRKTYDGDTTARLTLGNYAVSGVVDGDTVNLSIPTGTYTTGGSVAAAKDAGSGKTVAFTGLGLASATGGTPAQAVFGYTVANSALSFSNGAIAPAPLTVSANAASKTYDAQPYTGGNGVGYAGFVNNETATVLGGTLAYGGTARGAINAGSYVITPSGLTSGNYSLTFVDGALTVNKAALTVSSIDVSKTYDGTTTAAGQIRVVAGQLYGNDSLRDGSFSFADPAAGSNKTLLVSAVAVSDGNGGGNYALVLASNTTSTILQTPVVVPVPLPVAAAPGNAGSTTPAASSAASASGTSDASGATGSSTAASSSGTSGAADTTSASTSSGSSTSSGASDASGSSTAAAPSSSSGAAADAAGSSGSSSASGTSNTGGSSASSSGSSTGAAAPAAKGGTSKVADAGSGKGKADGKGKDGGKAADGKGKDGGKANGKDGKSKDGKGKEASKLAGQGKDGKDGGKRHEGGKFADRGKDGGRFADRGRDGGKADGKRHEGGKFADRGKEGSRFADKGKDGGKVDGKGREEGKMADGARSGRPAIVRSAAAQAKSVAAASRISDRFAQINAGVLAAAYAGTLAANASAAVIARINTNTNPVSLMNRGLPPDSSALNGVRKENPLVPPVCDGRPCSKGDSNAAMAVQIQAQASGAQPAPSDSLSESFHEIPWKGNSGIHKVARSRASVTYTETLEEVNFMGTLTLFIIP